MSLMKSLARVAAGVMLAKGVGSMMQRGQSPQQGRRSTRTTGGGILGDLLGGRGSTGSAGGGLGGMLGQVLGGRTAANPGTGRPYGGSMSGGASGGLGGILDQFTRAGATRTGSMSGGTTGGASGGMGGLLGGLLGGAAGGAAAGGLGGLLGDMLNGPAQRGAQPRNDRSFGEEFNDALVRQDEPEVPPTPEQNAVAGLMLRAMIQAAKADGKIDDQERERLLGQLGDLDDADRQFIRDQMAAPVDAAGLAREVPQGLERQVYMMSVLAIDFDNEAEARYLHDLAQALGLAQDDVNEVHEKVGVQNLYG
ncbi:tellurite resistance TerB family protein [uncultured Paracoccus sp.]|uniref:tellurite resistance TerB family protein n=1 Tax=uncultured Paracoccus sp. TaxID=189685 RepID=UPI002619D300|nr:tellurite resistance TerB family protein [uncultured Paracoccus sp.]